MRVKKFNVGTEAITDTLKTKRKKSAKQKEKVDVVQGNGSEAEEHTPSPTTSRKKNPLRMKNVDVHASEAKETSGVGKRKKTRSEDGESSGSANTSAVEENEASSVKKKQKTANSFMKENEKIKEQSTSVDPTPMATKKETPGKKKKKKKKKNSPSKQKRSIASFFSKDSKSPSTKQKRSIASFFSTKSSSVSSSKRQKIAPSPEAETKQTSSSMPNNMAVVEKEEEEEEENVAIHEKKKPSRKVVVSSSDEEEEEQEDNVVEEVTVSKTEPEEERDIVSISNETTTQTTTGSTAVKDSAMEKASPDIVTKDAIDRAADETVVLATLKNDTAVKSTAAKPAFASIFTRTSSSKKSKSGAKTASSSKHPAKLATFSPRTFFSKAISHVPLRKTAKSSSSSEPAGASSGATTTTASATGTVDTRSRPYELWNGGEPVPYRALSAVFAQIEGTTKRLEIQMYLTHMFCDIVALTPEDLLPAVYLASNKLAPQFEGIELGIGDSLLIKAIVKSTGRSTKQVKADYDKQGDLGIVAEQSRSSQKTLFTPKPLKLRQVYQAFRDIAAISGSKSQDKKVSRIQRLLSACKTNEARFITRGLQGKLRIGLAAQTVYVSLATTLAKRLHSESDNAKKTIADETVEKAVSTLKMVMSECPSFDLVVPAALKYGWRKLPEHCYLNAGTPVLPMLAKPTTGSGEIFTRFSGKRFTCEYKYDGERAQIHLSSDGSVKIFSRNMEDNTNKYADVAKAFPKMLKPQGDDDEPVTSIIIDSEVVAYDVEKDRLLPFQQLSHRKKKTVEGEEQDIKVIIVAFDLLLVNDTSLLKKSFSERRAALHKYLQESKGVLKFAESYDVDCTKAKNDGDAEDDMEEVNRFLHKAVEDGTEGLMVKTMDVNASYEPSVRSLNWLKLKKDYVDGCGDSLDLIPIAAWKGKGKRTGVYGAYLLACYDDEEDQYQTVCKVGTGFSDVQLREFTEQLSKHAIPKPDTSYCYSKEKFKPDVWFETAAVWEIKAADLSISPVHMAGVGLVHESKGIALRFPRLIRVRDDKSPEDATTAGQVAEMYNSQSLVRA
eukprot:g2653.t1